MCDGNRLEHSEMVLSALSPSFVFVNTKSVQFYMQLRQVIHQLFSHVNVALKLSAMRNYYCLFFDLLMSCVLKLRTLDGAV